MSEPGGLAAQAIHQYGYLGLGFTLAINCMGVPIASEITLPLSGVLARAGSFDLIAVFSVAFVAQMVGLSLSYFIARHGGVELIERYGRYFFMKRKHLVKLQKHFERQGARLILIGAS